MPEVHPIKIQTKACSRRLPQGQVAYAYFTFVDLVVTVTDCNGKALQDESGKIYTRTMEPGATLADAESAARSLFREYWKAAMANMPPSGFSGGGGWRKGPLDYPGSGWC